MPPLTLQIHHDIRGWLDAATLAFLAPGQVRLEYDVDYASEFVGRTDRFALSVAWPVDLRIHEGPLPAFVLDLIPQGEPLKRLLARYALTDTNDIPAILARIPLAPPGNIRVKEPWVAIEAQRSMYTGIGFTREQITERNRDFVGHMEASGAPIGGTSGAGGGSPKFMLREDAAGRLHAEGWLDDTVTRRAILVKLPYSDTENAHSLARVEKLYYDLLRALPVITGSALEIEADTLFITRFDRVRVPGGPLLYHGLESFYSAHGINVHGARLRHEDNIALLARHSTAPAADIIEYIKRDILNQMLANTDNHGRNTSLIKMDGAVRLSPIYDVTAMQFFTGDFITELTKWDEPQRPLTRRLDWVAAAARISRERLRAELVQLSGCTRDLTARMAMTGVPSDIVARSQAGRDFAQAELEALV